MCEGSGDRWPSNAWYNPLYSRVDSIAHTVVGSSTTRMTLRSRAGSEHTGQGSSSVSRLQVSHSVTDPRSWPSTVAQSRSAFRCCSPQPKSIRAKWKTKSPQQCFGAIAKTYLADKLGVDPARMRVISIMPCTAKKDEALRPGVSGDVDRVLTTRELARMIRSRQIPFAALPDEVRRAVVEEMRSGVAGRWPVINEDTMPGELSNIIAGRVANMLDLGGPNFVTDAACASSFAALHAAIEGLTALVRALRDRGHDDLILRTREELDLRDEAAVAAFYAEAQPTHVLDAAARAGGIRVDVDCGTIVAARAEPLRFVRRLPPLGHGDAVTGTVLGAGHGLVDEGDPAPQ